VEFAQKPEEGPITMSLNKNPIKILKNESNNRGTYIIRGAS